MRLSSRIDMICLVGTDDFAHSTEYPHGYCGYASRVLHMLTETQVILYIVKRF